MLREKCNRPMLEIYKCIHELGPRYRHGNVFSKK